MATTTTNYGFDVPTSSDLVKNGATQIALLGQDLDTFLFRPFSRNGVLNGSMNVWQRGTSLNYSAAGNPYGADRFNIFSGNTGTLTRQVTGDTTNLPNIQYSARTQRTAGVTSTAAFYFGQSLETVNSIPFVGKQVTFSYYARKGANFSGSTLQLFFKQSTGTDQNYVTGAVTGETTLSNVNIASTATTTWQRFTTTFTVTSAATQVGFYFYWLPSGTAGADDWFEVTGVQLEVGNQASPYTPYAATIQGELAACQRYYWRTTAQASSTDNILPYGAGISTTEVQVTGNFPVRMRTNPTAVEWAGLRTYDGTSFVTVTAITLGTTTFDSYLLSLNGASGMVQYRPTQTRSTSSAPANSYVGFSAEL